MLFAQAAQVQLAPETASTLAEQVDPLFYFVLSVTLFFTLLVAGLIVTFIIRYRRRSPDEFPKRIEGSLRLELFWTLTPLAIALFIFGWGAVIYMSWAEPPADALDVYVVGRQWMWHTQHPGGQREINRLHVPVGKPVRVTLTSTDVIHSFFVPAFRLHQDAIPGRYTTTWFEATRTGRFHLFCSEYCGTDHSAMIGEIVVMTPEGYQDWLARGADNSLAVKGRRLFQKLQCVACHTGDAQARAPSLEELYLRQVPLRDGSSVLADENYLRESIREPDAKIVAGFQKPSIMPAYGPDLVSEEEMIELIAFLRALGRGETPPRLDEAAPPVARAAADGKTEQTEKGKKR